MIKNTRGAKKKKKKIRAWKNKFSDVVSPATNNSRIYFSLSIVQKYSTLINTTGWLLVWRSSENNSGERRARRPASGMNFSQDIAAGYRRSVSAQHEPKKYFRRQMRTGRRRRRCNGANEFEHRSRKRERLKKREKEGERERERKGGRRTPKKSGRWVVRMSGLSEWMTDRQQPDRRLTARRRADSLPLCRAFATSSITDYRTCWSLSHSSTKSERTPPDFVLSRLTGSMIIFERARITSLYPFAPDFISNVRSSQFSFASFLKKASSSTSSFFFFLVSGGFDSRRVSLFLGFLFWQQSLWPIFFRISWFRFTNYSQSYKFY